MKRRDFLIGAGLFSVGAAMSSGLNRWLSVDSSFLDSDTERVLLRFYDPTFSGLRDLFPQIKSYNDALQELQQRCLLIRGRLDMHRMGELAKAEPVMDFAGWQHLRSELLVYLAAFLLVSDVGCAGGCSDAPALHSSQDIVFLKNVDFGEPNIKALRVIGSTDAEAAQHCAAACLGQAGCEYFTLAEAAHPVDAKRHVCWLKGAGVTVTKAPNYISGIRQRR